MDDLAHTPDTGLICAYRFHDGKAETLAAPEPGGPEGSWQWSHWNLKAEATRHWILTGAGLPPLAAEELIDPETRPGVAKIENGVMLTLRGVNLNEGAEPDLMLSLRLWIEPGRVISVRSERIFAVDAVRRQADDGTAWPTQGALVAEIVEGLTERTATVVEQLEEQVDEFELLEIAEHTDPLRSDVTDLRRDVVNLKRFLVPQRDALAKFSAMSFDWLSHDDRQEFSLINEELGRVVDMLAAVRERAMIIQETIDSDAAARMNRIMYMLSMVSTVFLPLTFVTGLLGINVGGIPGSHEPVAFWIVCALLVGVGILQLWLFRKLRMF